MPDDLLAQHALDVGAEYVAFDHCIAVPDDHTGIGATFGQSSADFSRENGLLVQQMLRGAVARGKLEVSEDSISAGIEQQPPYRMERVDHTPLTTQETRRASEGVALYFDSAHNTDAFDALFSTLHRVHAPKTGAAGDVLSIRVILGFSGEKDIRACLRRVLEYVPVSYPLRSPRVWSLSCVIPNCHYPR